MAELRLCRSEINIQGPAILGVHSNVVGNENSVVSGHAWVSVITQTEIYYFGLWPDKHPLVVERSEECTDVRIGMERGARAQVSRYYQLTPVQIIKLNQYVNRPDAWRIINTCADWALNLLREVVGCKLSASDYVFFVTPRELGKQLRDLENQSPTAINNPRQGAFPDEVQYSSGRF